MTASSILTVMEYMDFTVSLSVYYTPNHVHPIAILSFKWC